ncbi:MAG: cation-translocating P-type ATPase C-terminal domain-containing protein, partial [Planctomycetes bacterium]|nr:cation-translocating P-type ATPase C-terminal domain-containing protein [Planctomycetota bacterium]
PRAPDERIFDRLMVERVALAALVIGGVGCAAWSFLLESGMAVAEARNMVLLLMVLFENVQIGNCRSETQSLFRLSPLKSPLLLAATLGALAVHLLAMYLPGLRALLGTAPVGAREWLMLLGLALTASVAMEIHKLVWALRARGRGAA